MTAPPVTRPMQTPFGWCWSVPGAAGVEASRDAAEAQINRHCKTVRT